MLRFAAAVAFCMLGTLVAAKSKDYLQAMPNDGTEVFAVEAFHESGFTMHHGESKRFSVVEDPTSGYEWTWDQSSVNGAFTVKRNFVIEASDINIYGIGATFYFTVEAKSNGGKKKGVLKLYRAHAREGIKKATTVHEYDINVA